MPLVSKDFSSVHGQTWGLAVSRWEDAQVLDLIRRTKNLFISDETTFRRMRFGICKDCILPVNPRHQFRMLLGQYEAEISRHVRRLVRSGYCCYDIGAASGYYTLTLAKLAAPGQIYAIEPDESLYDLLQEAVKRNTHLDSEIDVMCSFMSDSDGEEQRMASLDNLVFEKGYCAPDFLKIDVDGGEQDVLRGARKVIGEHRPDMIVEVHSAELEDFCKEFLENQGYRITIVDQSSLIPEHRPLPHNRWLVVEKT